METFLCGTLKRAVERRIDRKAMPKTPRSFILLGFVLSIACVWLPAQRASQIDPFIGSDGGGNTFPGATVPFGMLKAGPDMGQNTGNAGWLAGKPINGFSQTHISGTGGGAKYGNVLIQPTVGPVLPANHSSPGEHERAAAGYYAVTLTRYNIGVEIAAARRAAIYRFTYPAASQANLLIDAGHLLSSYANQNENQSLVSSAVRVVSPTVMEGSTSVTGGWNQQTTVYTVYFYAESDTPAESSGTWRDGVVHPGSAAEANQKASRTGAWFTLNAHAGQVVLLKIGISFVSVEQARRNAAAELPGFDFAGVRAAAERAWDKALAPIEIEGASPDELRQFSTAIYHTMFQPTDVTGENPVYQTTEPSYDDFYAIWDTFRTSSPLLTLIAEDRESGIVRSLVDIYRHKGWLPDARSGEFSGRVQGGTDADMVLVDGYLKHLPGVDWKEAYKAVLNDAENTPPNPLLEGRGDLDDWRDRGYLTMEGIDRPASKNMEYAANDYAIALMAKGLGRSADYEKYLRRSGNWRNLWDAEAEDHGFNGFVWPRHRDGSWKANFDAMLSGTWGGDNFYEGNAWTYSTYVPQDVAGLIRASGGNARFVERMDAFFILPGCYDVGNEPGFLAPYLYIWAGRPDRTQFQIRSILARSYHSGPRGLPGNDDSGAMSSWYAFGKMGFYPIAAQDLYVIGSPAYPRVSIHLPNGHTFTIETEGDGPGKPYIAEATWNGRPFQRAWFTHDELMRGGTLRFTMSRVPTHWGAGDPPPSSWTGNSGK
jgi:predicted alpha-1,2-mannosidase